MPPNSCSTDAKPFLRLLALDLLGLSHKFHTFNKPRHAITWFVSSTGSRPCAHLVTSLWHTHRVIPKKLITLRLVISLICYQLLPLESPRPCIIKSRNITQKRLFFFESSRAFLGKKTRAKPSGQSLPQIVRWQWPITRVNEWWRQIKVIISSANAWRSRQAWLETGCGCKAATGRH